jgi:hypothetical protein
MIKKIVKDSGIIFISAVIVLSNLVVSANTNETQTNHPFILDEEWVMQIENTVSEPNEIGHLVPINGIWAEDIVFYALKIEYGPLMIEVTEVNVEGCVGENGQLTVYYFDDYFTLNVMTPDNPIPAGEGKLANLIVNITGEEGTTELNFSDTGNFYVNYDSKVRYPTLYNGIILIGENIPPETPNQPDGPTNGYVNEEYTYTTDPVTDPEGYDVQYLFDWGDGENSGWVDIPEATHAWSEPDVYAVKVKAKDIFNETSDWSDSLQVTISDYLPELKIESITGGRGLTAVIKNIGVIDATNVDWTITIEGGFIILTKEKSDTIGTLAVDGSQEINMFVFGFGLGIIFDMPTITITAECAEGPSAEDSVTAKIIFTSVSIE